MMEIEFHIDVEGEIEAPLLDAYELEILLDDTRAQIRQHILKRLGGMVCDEHGTAPKIIVTGAYSQETEQLEYSYHIEACCNLFTMRTAALLSRV